MIKINYTDYNQLRTVTLNYEVLSNMYLEELKCTGEMYGSENQRIVRVR